MDKSRPRREVEEHRKAQRGQRQRNIKKGNAG